MKKFIKRYKLYAGGRIEEFLVPRKQVEKEIRQLLKEDKELLEILRKL